MTVIFTVLTPVAVGVPLICPVDAFMLNPAGRPVADQVYGVAPPLALTVALYAAPTVPSGSDAVVMVSGPETVTVAVASAMFGDLAVITAVPGAMPHTGIFRLVGILPSQKNVNDAGTVATDGLLEVSVTVRPVGGGGAGPDSVSSRKPFACGLMVRLCGENVKLAVTWTCVVAMS